MSELPPRPRRSRRWRRLLLAGAGLLVLLYVVSSSVLAAVGAWLNVGESLRDPVDYVYVLGGDASTRPFLAAAVYRAGYAKQVLVPQSIDSVEVDGKLMPTEQQLIQEVLMRRGVPQTAIRQLEGAVTSTRDEARALAAFLADRKEATVAIVTNDFHTRRTRLIFRRLNPGHHDRLHFIAAPTDGFGPQNWWQFKDGVLWYVGEYAKLCRDSLR